MTHTDAEKLRMGDLITYTLSDETARGYRYVSVLIVERIGDDVQFIWNERMPQGKVSCSSIAKWKNFGDLHDFCITVGLVR